MTFSQPVVEITKQRYSCREYEKTPIDAGKQHQLTAFIAANQTGPFGSPTRFALAAAAEDDRQALRGLGTYGFIKSPTGFILGAMGVGEKNLEDFGYTMERIILFATDLGLGTCWLGGSFTKSRFAEKISANGSERVPAVTAVGTIATKEGFRQHLSHGWQRLGWDRLFFDGEFGSPLPRRPQVRTPRRWRWSVWPPLHRINSHGVSSRRVKSGTSTSSGRPDTRTGGS